MLGITWPGPVTTLFFGLGARGKPAEAVADEAGDEALAHRQTGMPVDPHSVDLWES
jgi:RNA 3'-terminal phosphate cyclase (ATP)